MYQPKHFRIEELAPREFFKLHKARGRQLWTLFDDRGLITLDRLRERYGKMTLNTWLWDEINPHQFRGFRPPDCEIGARLSQHRFGRGFDVIFGDVAAGRVRKDLLADPYRPEFEFITSIEEGISWFHFDTRNWAKKEYGVFRFKP